MKDLDYWKFEKEFASSEIIDWNNLADQYWEMGMNGEAIRTWIYMGEAYQRLEEAHDNMLKHESGNLNQEV